MDIEEIAERLFGEGEPFHWNRSRIDELIDGVLYQTDVHGTDGQRVSAQIYVGLGQLGGHLWEQDVRVLLRIGMVEHPALQRVITGAYSEGLDAAYVLTTRSPFTLDGDDSCVMELRADPLLALTHFERISDALAVLHGQGILHRNVWPGILQFTEGPDGELEELRIARFEMSSLVENIVRGSGDAAVAEQLRAFLRQPVSAISHTAPERLDELLVDGTTEHVETGAADIFSLGLVAAGWFLPDLASPSIGVLDTVEVAVVRQQLAACHDAVRDRLISAERVNAIPGILARLLRKMIEEHPNDRPNAFEVIESLRSNRDTILGLLEPTADEEHLVLCMPKESKATLYKWGALVNDPSELSAEGPEELCELIERDIRGGMLAHSPTGVRGFVPPMNAKKEEAATIVLIGREFAWFCQYYRPSRRRSGGTDRVWRHAIIVMFPVQLEWQSAVRNLPNQRSLPTTIVARWDLDPQDLSELANGRPSWESLVASSMPTDGIPQWQQDWIDGFRWLLDLRRAELDIGTFPFEREMLNSARRSAEIVEDTQARRKQLARSDVASELDDSLGNPSLGDFLDDLIPEDGEIDGGRVMYWPGTRWSPDYELLGRGSTQRLDPSRVTIKTDELARPVPERGRLRPADYEGSPSSLRRQEEAVAELVMSESLLRQFLTPHTIRGFTRYWPGVGVGLDEESGSREIVLDILRSQPFYALQGPPGTGKTTVIAHAVAAHLAVHPGARILVTAQSNSALDHIAERVLRLLRDRDIRHLPLRIAAERARGDLTPDLASIQLAQSAETVARQLQNHAATLRAELVKLKSGVEHPALGKVADEARPGLIALLAEWERTLDGLGPELRSRIRRGANLVFATCEGSNPQALDHRGLYPPFDWVIIEEAAKAWSTELAIPLMRAHRWTLIGDHKQLPAHRREEVEAFFQQCATSDRPGMSHFAERQREIMGVFDLFGGLFKANRPLNAPVRELTHQYRMQEPIAEVVSRAFYDGKLMTAKPAKIRTHGLTEPAFVENNPLVWLDTTDWDDEDEPFWCNRREADLVGRLVSALRAQTARATGWDEPRLAVLTPYHAQRRLLEDRGVGEVHTVHSYQGSEAEVIVASLVRTTARPGGPRRSIGHLSKPEVVNVMLSRARRLLVIVGKYGHFQSSSTDHWQKVCEAVDDAGVRIPVSDSGLIP